MSSRFHQLLFTRLNQRILLTSGLVLLVLYVGGDVFKIRWIKPNLWYATSVPAIALGVATYARFREELDSSLSSSHQIDDNNSHQLNDSEVNPFQLDELVDEMSGVNGMNGVDKVNSDDRSGYLLNSQVDARPLLLQAATTLPPDSMVRFIEAAAKLLPDSPSSPSALPPASSNPKSKPKNEINPRAQSTAQSVSQPVLQSAPRPAVQPTAQPASQKPATNSQSRSEPNSSGNPPPGRVVQLFPDEDYWTSGSEQEPQQSTNRSMPDLFPDPTLDRNGSGSNSNSNGATWFG